MSVAPGSPARGKGAGKGKDVPKRESVKSNDSPPPRKFNCPMPICGGWCAATENPDESCFRHFSNEWTIPAQACFFACLPCIETNKFCQIVGHFAFQVSTGLRKIIFTIGLILSFVVMIIFLLAMMGLLTSEGGISTFYWFRGTTGTAGPWNIEVKLGVNGGSVEFTGFTTEQKIAIDDEWEQIRANVAATATTPANTHTAILDPDTNNPTPIRNPNFNSADIVKEDRNEGNTIFFNYYKSEFCPMDILASSSACNETDTAEQFMMIFFLSLLAFIAQITAAMANCQRWTEFGDANCQKFWAFFSAILVCSSAFSIYFLAKDVLTKLPTNRLHPMGSNENASAGAWESASVTWEISIWIWLILVAGCIKILDIIIHCLVATPPGRHQKPNENNPYVDLPDYLLRIQDCEHAAIPYSATH